MPHFRHPFAPNRRYCVGRVDSWQSPDWRPEECPRPGHSRRARPSDPRSRVSSSLASRPYARDSGNRPPTRQRSTRRERGWKCRACPAPTSPLGWGVRSRSRRVSLGRDAGRLPDQRPLVARDLRSLPVAVRSRPSPRCRLLLDLEEDRLGASGRPRRLPQRVLHRAPAVFPADGPRHKRDDPSARHGQSPQTKRGRGEGPRLRPAGNTRRSLSRGVHPRMGIQASFARRGLSSRDLRSARGRRRRGRRSQPPSAALPGDAASRRRRVSLNRGRGRGGGANAATGRGSPSRTPQREAVPDPEPDLRRSFRESPAKATSPSSSRGISTAPPGRTPFDGCSKTAGSRTRARAGDSNGAGPPASGLSPFPSIIAWCEACGR